METYFKQRNWEPFAYKRLNEVIRKYKNDQNAYAVFDFDNTSIIMDIEDNFMIYSMENLLYQLSPKELHDLLTADFFKEELSRSWDLSNEQVTGYNLADDIVTEYEWLYDAYINNDNKSEALLLEIRSTERYKTFAAKLRYFYNYVNTYLIREPSEAWLTYLFAGHTVEEFKNIAVESVREAVQKPFERVIFESSSELPGKTGQVTSQFKSGLSVPPELLNLFSTFENEGISTYIVSASPRQLVKVAVKEFGYSISKNQIIAMEFKVDEHNVIQPIMTDNDPITRGKGKTEAINTRIMPNHNYREPIAMFGDSIGDYDMMTTFKEADVNVLFNRHRTDEFRLLVEKAVEQYDTPNAQFVLQGRDENSGFLISSQASIPFEGQSASIFKED